MLNFISGLKNVWFFIFVACFESDGVFESEFLFGSFCLICESDRVLRIWFLYSDFFSVKYGGLSRV